MGIALPAMSGIDVKEVLLFLHLPEELQKFLPRRYSGMELRSIQPRRHGQDEPVFDHPLVDCRQFLADLGRERMFPQWDDAVRQAGHTRFMVACTQGSYPHSMAVADLLGWFAWDVRAYRNPRLGTTKGGEALCISLMRPMPGESWRSPVMLRARDGSVGLVPRA